MKKSELVGTWSLLSNSHVIPTGKEVFPLGKRPMGQLTYTADGFMSVLISKRQRRVFSSTSLTGSSNAEKIEAGSHFLCYSGRYEIEKDHVVHHIDINLFSNRAKKEQIRFFKLSGDRLILTSPVFYRNNEPRIGKVVWKRQRR